MARNRKRAAVFTLIAVGIALAVSVALGADAPAAGRGTTRHLIGRSVQGRAIYAYQRGDPYGPTVLIVGSIHGNEPDGVAVARRLLKTPAPEGVDLWVILNLNPDGRAAGTRGNAHGVDLNRNFPWRWRRLGRAFYSGRRRLSEPESRAAYRLIKRLRPRLSIWFHQPLGAVSITTRSLALERKFARLAGLGLARLPAYPGSATSWKRHLLPESAAFVAELPGGRLGERKVDRYARAVLTVSKY
ncbi:MAG TPA: M14 family zinc carboxypeptidase [Gaiellaceae bacterium]